VPAAQSPAVRLAEQAAVAVPDDRTVVVERFRDEVGDWRVCSLMPYGRSLESVPAACMAR
jgi:ATP-dependent helicase Lhr and Lhr-like helicase